MTKEELLEDIISGSMAVEMFSCMKKKYKGTGIGFHFEDLHKIEKKDLMKMIRMYEKEFNEKVDMRIIKGL